MIKNTPLRVCLFGGSDGSVFPRVHNRAILLTERAMVTCGVFSRNPETSLATARAWPHTVTGYRSVQEAIEAYRRGLFDYATIVTPDSSHFALARALIEAGIPLVLEKPVTLTAAEAEELLVLARAKNVPVAVAHTYYGHWSTRFVGHIVRSGKLGSVRAVESNYPQGWMAYLIEAGGTQRQSWRADEAQAGASCCGGDIGGHAAAQVKFATGLGIETVIFADLRTVVPGRKLDDSFFAFCRLSNGAMAKISAAQFFHGSRNAMSLKVVCEHGTVDWRQEDSENIYVSFPDGRTTTYGRGAIGSNLSGLPHLDDPFLGPLPDALAQSFVLPGGHGAGFHDALAHIHGTFLDHVRRWKEDPQGHPAAFNFEKCGYPTLADGVGHMQFLEASIRASKTGRPCTV